jgi:hypothetical protein
MKMKRTIALAFFILLMAVPVWAGGPERFDPDQPFEQALTTNVLRSLLNQAMDMLEDHLEISGNLNPDEKQGDRRGNFKLKFYPEGKSKSDEHLLAEGSFDLSPDSDQQDFLFRFKLPKEPSKKSFQQPDGVL